MTDYTKLVEALRIRSGNLCPGDICDRCEAIHFLCSDKVMHDAAAAIEELQAEVKRLNMRCADCEYGNSEWPEDPEHTKMPTLGEWQKAKPKGVVTYSDGYAECSHCHEAIWLGWGMNFCPHCGTQNKIIDPDDYDGAKMEVQDG